MVLVFTEVVVVVDEVVAVDVVVALLVVFPADVVVEPEATAPQDERNAALTANGISQRALKFLMIETLFSLKVTLEGCVLLGKKQQHRQKRDSDHGKRNGNRAPIYRGGDNEESFRKAAPDRSAWPNGRSFRRRGSARHPLGRHCPSSR